VERRTFGRRALQKIAVSCKKSPFRQKAVSYLQLKRISVIKCKQHEHTLKWDTQTHRDKASNSGAAQLGGKNKHLPHCARSIV
jgi:hypothetical protein